MNPNTDAAVEQIYAKLYGAQHLEDYHERHDTPSLLVLTIRSPDEAEAAIADWVDEIRGKRVVEIGAGIGYLSLELAKHAAHVYAVELDPAWTWVFVKHLYVHKPANLTWVFGNAESLVGLTADVAVISSYSGVEAMVQTAAKLAPTIVLDLAQGFYKSDADHTLLLNLARKIDAMVPSKLGV